MKSNTKTATKPRIFDEHGRKIATIGATGTALMLGNSAHAAGEGLDLSGLTSQLQNVQTSVVGVVAVAVTIGVVIVGWRWAKRALFSL